MDVFHLSHTDLDGYGCQLITDEIFKSIKFYNSNYGEEISFRIDQIFADIDKSPSEDILILITDLNLSKDESKKIDKLVKNYKGKNITLTLLDHHASGEESSNLFEWYHLDTTKSASKITYDHFLGLKPKKISRARWLKPTVEMINAIDIWLENDRYFEFGKVAMRLINETKELNRYMFDKEHREYKLKTLRWASKYLAKKNGHIKLDDSLIKIKKRYFGEEGKKDILDNHISKYLTNLLKDKKEELIINIENKKGILTYQLGYISTVANEFLKQNSDIDFFIDINSKGSCSLRASGKVDLTQIAQKYFNGGGHPNASGGRVEGFKESFSYGTIKEFVTNYIKERE